MDIEKSMLNMSNVSKRMLYDLIGELYNREKAILSKLTPEIVLYIQRDVSEGTYSLSPLRYVYLPKDGYRDPIFKVFTNEELPDYFMLVCPSFEEDELVLLALGLMLHDHFLKVSL